MNNIAPDFLLPRFGNGESRYYQEAGTRLAVLIFYKFSCSTCRLAMPYFQRIYDAYGDAFYFAAIAQDGSEKTAGFRQECGITMPTMMDQAPYPVSTSYSIHTVPSIFVVDPDRRIRYEGFGFVKQEILNLADVLAEKTGRPQIDVFEDAEVPESKPG